tara:strand:- start:38 stop:946 length:909 start_codon:yes stop_codon:yes gene_type:complete
MLAGGFYNEETEMRVGELFAGIGGIGLGLEWTGEFEVVWQVEKDDYATKVLEKNWPAVRRWDDVCTFPPETGTWECDLICGGFPCQDISFAGKGAGLEGERSGLFYEGIRIIKTLRPRWVLLENVSALLVRGLGDVLRELAEIGYDAEWHCVPAASVGAPHRRDRIFILAHTHSSTDRFIGKEEEETDCVPEINRTEGCSRLSVGTGGDTSDVANSDSTGLERFRETGNARQVRAQETLGLLRSSEGERQWGIEPRVARMGYGFSHRIQRTRCLGNAVVPQVAQFIGEIIIQRDQELFRKDE